MACTADEAFDASEDGEPILLNYAEVCRLCRAHGQDPDEYKADSEALGYDLYDAANLFQWLGY